MSIYLVIIALVAVALAIVCVRVCEVCVRVYVTRSLTTHTNTIYITHTQT